MALGLI